MAGERFYTRIPPSSTGNRIGLKHTAAVSYTNRTGLIDENAIYTLSTSGIKFTVHTIRPINLTTGLMIGTYDKNSAFFNLSPTTGENIINDDGVVVGQIGTTVEDIFTNVTNIVGFNNASYGLRIDEDGSANIRFSEGVPQLDAFGKLRISGATLLGEYVFSNGIMPQYVSTTELGNSSATWDKAGKNQPYHDYQCTHCVLHIMLLVSIPTLHRYGCTLPNKACQAATSSSFECVAPSSRTPYSVCPSIVNNS